MSVVILPLRTDLPHYTFNTELDGVQYGFELQWNARDSAWLMSISMVDGTPLLSGIRVTGDSYLAWRFKDSRLPPGLLVSQDTTGKHADPGLTDLGKRVQVLYYDAATVGRV